MSEKFKFELRLRAPRWGATNIYEIHLEKDCMTIGKRVDPNPVVCSWYEGENTIWSSASPLYPGRNPLVSKLQEDLIQPPVIFPRALEVAWRAWRIGLLDDEQVQFEMSVLFEWVNIVTSARPRTDFWERLF